MRASSWFNHSFMTSFADVCTRLLHPTPAQPSAASAANSRPREAVRRTPAERRDAEHRRRPPEIADARIRGMRASIKQLLVGDLGNTMIGANPGNITGA